MTTELSKRMIIGVVLCLLSFAIIAQPDTIVIGFGGNLPSQVSSSDPASKVVFYPMTMLLLDFLLKLLLDITSTI